MTAKLLWRCAALALIIFLVSSLPEFICKDQRNTVAQQLSTTHPVVTPAPIPIPAPVSPSYDEAVLNNLKMFSANSANDEKHKHLWIKGAGLYVPLINELLAITSNYSSLVKSCDNYFQDNEDTTRLVNLFNKYTARTRLLNMTTTSFMALPCKNLASQMR